MVLIEFLLFLFINFGNCDEYNITILYFGESDDIDITTAIIGAVNYMNEHESPIALVDIVSYNFSSNEDVKTVCQSITDEVIPDLILDATRIKKHAIVAEKIAVSYGLPTISTSYIERSANEEDFFRKYDPKKNYLMKVKRPSSMFNELIDDIVKMQGMTNVAVIYSPEFVTSKSLRTNFNSRGISCIFLKYTPEKLTQAIHNLKLMYFQNVFLLGNITVDRYKFEKYQVVYSILTDQNDLSNQGDVFAYPFVKNRQRKQAIYKKGGIHIDAVFHFELTIIGFLSIRALIDKNRPEYQDSSCENTNYPSRTDLGFRDYCSRVMALQDDLTYGRFTIGNRDNSCMYFDIHIACNTKKTRPWVATYRMELNNTITFHNETLFKTYKPTSHYKVLARLKPPFVYYNQTTRKAFGYNIDLLDLMASILDFTYEITVIETHQSDFYPDSGKSNGFISEMLNREVDIGLGPVYPSVIYRMVDFSIPYYKPIGIKFIMKRSKDDSIFTFITVLETIVWVCILSAFFLSSFMLWSAERFSPYSYRNNKERYKDVEEVRDFTMKECLWFCLTSLTPQGGGIVPQHLSGRLVVVTWWLFGFIILASYTANLSAFLTLSKMKNPIESFTDLYRQFRMHYAPLNGSDEEAYFINMAKAEEEARSYIRNNEYPLPNKYARMKQIILNSTYPITVDEALERVYLSVSATEGFAFLVDSMDAKYLLMTRCNLIDIEEEVGKRPLVIALPKYTLMKHNIDKALTIIMERGLDKALEKKWWDDNPYKATHCVELEDESDGIGIYNIGGVFLMIFIGIGIASLTIVYDYLKYINRQRTRVTVVAPINNANTLEDTAGVNEIEIPKKNEEVENFSKLQHRNVTRY